MKKILLMLGVMLVAVFALAGSGEVACGTITCADRAMMTRLQKTLREKIVAGEGCGPFYAAVVDTNGMIVAEQANGVVRTNCSHAHAEMQAIAAAEKKMGTWNLSGKGLTLYTTAEPCMMCVGGILWSGIARVVYGLDTASVERISGFDEGFKPNWRDEFKSRGIEVVGPVLPGLGADVMREYVTHQGTIYAPKR